MNIQTDVTTQEAVWVPISQITVPEDARPHTAKDIDSRSDSMAREGQLESILLSKERDRLVLVYGNGRLESAKKLNWEKIQATIKEGLTQTQKLRMALAENAERENESPFHTAAIYQKLMETNDWTQEQLATEMGKELKTITRYMSLAKLAPEVQKIGHACPIGLRQCLEVAKLAKVEDQLKVMEECATQDLAGKALEARIKQLLKPQHANEESAAAKKPAEPDFRFTWKADALDIKFRRFHPVHEEVHQYLSQLEALLMQELKRKSEADTASAAKAEDREVSPVAA